ncbi:MAG: hypothetical protein GY861_23625 [bacterium]|nr:hypothetical protein [bacterium]
MKQIISVLMVIMLLTATGIAANPVNEVQQIEQRFDLSDFPNPFVKDGAINTIVVVGINAPVDDVVSAVDILTSLRYSTTTSGTGSGGRSGGGSSSSSSDSIQAIDVGTVKFDTEITNLNQNIITIGSPCDNKITDRINGANCQHNLKPGQGIIKLQRYKSYYHLIVGGHSKKDTRNAAKVLSNYDENSDILRGTKVIIETYARECKAKDTIHEGDTKKYELTKGEYKVTLNYVDSNKCIFTVNGQKSPKLYINDKFTLSDGTTLKVQGILNQNFAGGVRMVQFELNACEEPVDNTKITIGIKKKWNLVSMMPFERLSEESTCDPTNFKAVFSYFPIEGTYGKFRFEQVSPSVYQLVGASSKDQRLLDKYANFEESGYLIASPVNSAWVYSKETCELVMEYSEEDSILSAIDEYDLKLAKGWNMFSVIPEMKGKTLSDIKGTCDINKAYKYNSNSKNWVDSSHATFGGDIGEGIIIKVENDCVLGEEMMAPPPMPI